VDTTPDTLPDDVDALKAALLAERAARREFEARASGAEAMVAHLKLMIAKMKRDRFGASAERGRKLLDQLEMQLEELETAYLFDNLDHGLLMKALRKHCQEPWVLLYVERWLKAPCRLTVATGHSRDTKIP
jgi:hypothetical protein